MITTATGPEASLAATSATVVDACLLAGRRIVIYGMNYAPEIAGVGKYTGEIAAYFAARGADVTVVTTPPHYPGWSIQAGYQNRYYGTLENGVRVLRSPLLLRRKMSGIWRLLAPLTFALSSAPVVFYEILRRRPEIVFCVEPTLLSAPVAQFAAWLVGANTLLHAQDLEVDAAFAVGHIGSKAWVRELGYTFEKLTLGRFDRIVTISTRMAEKICKKGVKEERVSVVRNWVDLSHIFPLEEESPFRAEFGFTKDDYVVLYSGNIGAKQGLKVLLDAAEKLKDQTRVHFVVAGEGPLKAEFECYYGHLDNVHFQTFQPYARLNEFLNMADVHVLPQDKGAADLVLPSKLGGMLASGKEVIITTDHDTELADFVSDAVIITPPGDASKLADVIGWLAERHIVRDGTAARRLALARQLSQNEALSELLAVAGVELIWKAQRLTI